jgi:uncharacterized protein YkwD
LHQAAVALLAVPILVAVYVGALLRRSTLARVGLAVGLSLVLGIGVIGAGRPSVTVATPPTPIVPLTQAAFSTTVTTDRELDEPVTLAFSGAMDRASVEASLTIDPPTAVDLAWDAADTTLTISPRGMWAAGTFHTVTVPAGALAASGQPLSRPARAVFLTRDATTGSIAATDAVGKRVAVGAAFQVTFARPVDPTTVRDAIRLDPPTPGTLETGLVADGVARYTFVPASGLRADTTYKIIVSGVRDGDGLTLEPFALVVRTTKAPAVVRFRPRADTQDVALDAAISVRFTESMNRRSTASAFVVTADAKVVAGKISWAESSSVLVFTPTAALPYDAKVVVDVGLGARSAAGAPIADTHRQGAFQTVKKPVVAPAPKPTAKPAPKPAPKPATKPISSGGGAVGGGSWGYVETYYLHLMNCTRQGGWVTSTGACSSPGGRNVAALRLDSGISSKVSRPYAKKLAVGNDCSHFIGGNPGDRLRRAGYTSYRWAENLGCRSGSPKGSVLGSHLFFQSERSYNGGHYVNLMNSAYDRVGIGVWVYGGRVRLVVDFYHP